MAMKKIPCGGFYYNDESIEFIDGVMQAKGGKDWVFEVKNEDGDLKVTTPDNIDELVQSILSYSISPSKILVKHYDKIDIETEQTLNIPRVCSVENYDFIIDEESNKVSELYITPSNASYGIYYNISTKEWNAESHV